MKKDALVAEHFSFEVGRLSNLDLDFSIESIDSIDNIIGYISGTDDQEKLEFIYNRLIHIGCSVGEVIIRNFGGMWMDTTDKFDLPLGIKGTGSKGNIYTNPIGKVIKRYKEGKKHDLKTYVISQALLKSSLGFEAHTE